MKTEEVLTEAKALIPDYEHWATGIQVAVNKGARPYGYGHDGCYCPVGAITAVTEPDKKDNPGDPQTPEGKGAVVALAKAINPYSTKPPVYTVTRFNDVYCDGDLSKIHDAFDRAIDASD